MADIGPQETLLPPTPLWTIDGVEDAFVTTPGGGFEKGKAIRVRLPDGSTFTIEVKLSEYTGAGVRRRIEQQMQHEAEVRALRGPEVHL